MPAKAVFASLAYRLDLRNLESLPFTPPPLRGHEKEWQPEGGWPATLGEAFDCLRRFSGLDDPHAYLRTVLAAGRLDCLESDVVMPNGTLPVGRDTFGNAFLLQLVRFFKHDAYPFAATWFYFGRDRFCSEGCPDADLYQFFLAGGDTIFSSIGTIFASKGFDPSVFVPAERWSLVDSEDCGSPSVEPDDSANSHSSHFRSSFLATKSCPPRHPGWRLDERPRQCQRTPCRLHRPPRNRPLHRRRFPHRRSPGQVIGPPQGRLPERTRPGSITVKAPRSCSPSLTTASRNTALRRLLAPAGKRIRTTPSFGCRREKTISPKSRSSVSNTRFSSAACASTCSSDAPGENSETAVTS